MFPNEEGMQATFTLESEKGVIIEEVPFRILVLGDWSGDGETRELPGRRPIEIDRDNFDEVMEWLGVRLHLKTTGPLTLEFRKLDDFHPDEIYRKVPAFSELRDLRRRLKDPNTFNAAAREIRDSFGAEHSEQQLTPEPSGSVPADDLLDAILSQPAGGAPAPRAGARGELASLVSELVRPHLVNIDEDEQRTLVAAVDEATSALMRQILHDRMFQELEAAWRGLWFQVRGTDTGGDLKIYLLDVSKEELSDDLREAKDLAETQLANVLMEIDEDEPWSLVCGNYSFDASVDDVAMLVRLSKLSAAANAPLVSHIRPDILGVHSLAEHPDPREWEMSTDFDAGTLWATLRGLAESRYLGMTMPRVLARLPYGSDTDPTEAFSFEEFASDWQHDDYLWANGCFAAGLLYAKSFNLYEWEMGKSLVQDLEDLPLHIYKRDGETVFQPCAEVLLTQHACERLMEYGVMPLVSYKNTDRVRLARFQSITDPVTALKGRWN